MPKATILTVTRPAQEASSFNHPTNSLHRHNISISLKPLLSGSLPQTISSLLLPSTRKPELGQFGGHNPMPEASSRGHLVSRHPAGAPSSRLSNMRVATGGQPISAPQLAIKDSAPIINISATRHGTAGQAAFTTRQIIPLQHWTLQN